MITVNADYRDYKPEDFTGPGYYLVHYNRLGETLDQPVSYHHPKPGGPYDTIKAMAIAERLDDYPHFGYVVWYDGEAATSVPSLNPDELVQRDPIPDVATAEPDERGWKRENIATFDAGTGIGGDNMVGLGYETRYHRQLDDGTYAVITENWFVEDLNRIHNREPGDEDYEPGEYGIQCMIEYMHCGDLDDVGGTEISSDIEYEDNNNQPFATYDDVLTWYENECLRCAAQDHRPDYFYLDDKHTAKS